MAIKKAKGNTSGGLDELARMQKDLADGDPPGAVRGDPEARRPETREDRVAAREARKAAPGDRKEARKEASMERRETRKDEARQSQKDRATERNKSSLDTLNADRVTSVADQIANDTALADAYKAPPNLGGGEVVVSSTLDTPYQGTARIDPDPQGTADPPVDWGS